MSHTTDATSTVSRRLAGWVDDLTFEQLPLDVVDITRRMILDQLGLQFRGATLPNIQPVLRLVHASAGVGEATVTGNAVRTSVAQAAYANGTMGHSGEFDDAHLNAWHAGSVVVGSREDRRERQRRDRGGGGGPSGDVAARDRDLGDVAYRLARDGGAGRLRRSRGGRQDHRPDSGAVDERVRDCGE